MNWWHYSLFCICTGNNFQHFIAKGCVFFTTTGTCTCRTWISVQKKICENSAVPKQNAFDRKDNSTTLLNFEKKKARNRPGVNLYKLDAIHKRNHRKRIFVILMADRSHYFVDHIKKNVKICPPRIQNMMHWKFKLHYQLLKLHHFSKT